MRIDPRAHVDDPGTVVYHVTSPSDDLDRLERLDTRELANGVHALFVSTIERNEFGINTGILKLLIDVQN